MAAFSTDPFELTSEGLKVRIRLSPNASANRIEGLCDLPDGGCGVKARVTAIPEKGKANAALVKLLSKEWGLPKSTISIIAGGTDRTKVLLLADTTEEDKLRIGTLLEQS